MDTHDCKDLALDLHHIDFSYNADPVLTDLSLQVPLGSVTILHGDNGSGKSTLLRLILGEIKPKHGSIILMGNHENKHALAYPQIGYVPQVQNMAQITFPITCLELVALDLYREVGFVKFLTRKAREKAGKQLAKLGLAEFASTPFKDLSGGLKQRVMIARALMREPKLLILDEPTAGVDEESKQGFLDLIRKLNQEGMTLVIVTHELGLLLEKLPQAQTYLLEGGHLHASL